MLYWRTLALTKQNTADIIVVSYRKRLGRELVQNIPFFQRDIGWCEVSEGVLEYIPELQG